MKTLFLLLVASAAAALQAAEGYELPAGAGVAESFGWPEGKRVALSLSFDDARPSQLDQGLPLFAARGVKATFYVSPQRMTNRLEGWREAVRQGHEIGNHSMTHPCTGNYPFSRENALEDYTLAEMGLDIEEAEDVIQEGLGVEPRSFAYPCGQTFVGRGEGLQSYVPWVAPVGEVTEWGRRRREPAQTVSQGR